MEITRARHLPVRPVRPASSFEHAARSCSASRAQVFSAPGLPLADPRLNAADSPQAWAVRQDGCQKANRPGPATVIASPSGIRRKAASTTTSVRPVADQRALIANEFETWNSVEPREMLAVAVSAAYGALRRTGLPPRPGPRPFRQKSAPCGTGRMRGHQHQHSWPASSMPASRRRFMAAGAE